MNRDNPQLHDVYHLNLRSGELKLLEKNPGNVIGWVSDAEMKVRGAIAATPAQAGFDLASSKEQLDSEWEKIIEWSEEDNLNSSPVAFTREGNSLYLADSRNANAARLVKLNRKLRRDSGPWWKILNMMLVNLS